MVGKMSYRIEWEECGNVRKVKVYSIDEAFEIAREPVEFWSGVTITPVFERNVKSKANSGKE